MIIKNNKCGKIFTKSKYIFLQRRASFVVCEFGVGRKKSRRWKWQVGVVVCIIQTTIEAKHSLELHRHSFEGKNNVHKVRMYRRERYENIKVKTQTSVKEENIRKYDLICVSRCGFSRDVARYTKHSVVSVFYFFGGSTVKLCLYSARARNDCRKKEKIIK